MVCCFPSLAVLTVGFTQANYTVNEDAGSVQFCFTATGNLSPELTASVNVTSQPLSAQGTNALWDSYYEMKITCLILSQFKICHL